MKRDNSTVTMLSTESGLWTGEVLGKNVSQIAVLALQFCVLLKLAVILTVGSELKCNSNFFSRYLTLRRLMSYIYIYIYMEHPFLMFLDHTQRRSTIGRTPLDE